MSKPCYSSEDEEFFRERLEIFMQKNIGEISEFAKREGRDPDNMRKSVAEWHAAWLFNHTISGELNSEARTREVSHALEQISENLQYLHNVTGHHSLLLVVDPTTDEDGAFLGGTSTGRTFWNGLRGGGTLGARQFKQQCKSLSSTDETGSSSNPTSTTERVITGNRQTPAVILKNNLYNEMRAALRLASGNTSAEMKWSKPEKLTALGVQLVGWPPSVPFKNPSRMSQQEMTLIRNLLMENRISFLRVGDRPEIAFGTNIGSTASMDTHDPPDADVDISWALEDDGSLDGDNNVSVVSSKAPSGANDTQTSLKRRRI